MVLSLDLIELRKKIRDSKVANDFERDFIQSVFSYNALRLMGDVNMNDLKKDVPINMSYKQEAVFLKLQEKYNDSDY